MTEQQAPLMLGVSGLRGWIGRSLTPRVATRFAEASGDWLKVQRRLEQPHVVVGRDSRPSGPMVEQAVIAGLLAVGCRVTRLGIVSTPAAALMVTRLHADGGLMLTASHNPQPWNGIKPLRADGVAPPAEEAQALIDRYHADAPQRVEVEGLQSVDDDDSTAGTHAAAVAEHLDGQAIRAASLTMVVDSVCGAGGQEVQCLAEKLGVTLRPLNSPATGWFPHMPEPVKDHLGELCQQVPAQRAAVGFAQDPDADRLAIVDEAGRFIGEEYTLALCAMHLMGVSGASPCGEPARAAVANLSTSRMLDDVAAQAGAVVYRTPVGEANVAAKMRETGARIGGEGNGGIIDSRIGQVRNSLLGIGLVLEMLAKTGKSVSELVAATPAYAMVKEKLELGQTNMAQVTTALTEAFADQHIDTQDGVRIDWPDRWVHVRPSNTEPVVRLIGEAKDDATARQLIDQVRTTAGL
jgi:phosphomannomutase